MRRAERKCGTAISTFAITQKKYYLFFYRFLPCLVGGNFDP